MGRRFLEKLVYVWVYFQIFSGTSLPKPNLGIPRGSEHTQRNEIQIEILLLYHYESNTSGIGSEQPFVISILY